MQSGKRFLKTLIVYTSIIVGLVVVPAAYAQTAGADPERQRLMAVMSIITMMLLDGREPPIDPPDGVAIPLTINELSPDTYPVTQGNAVFAQFDLQDEGVEFCFDLASNVPLGAGDIVVEVNGEAVTAVEGKDNCYQIPEHLQRDINYVVIQVVNPAVTLTITRVELAASVQTELGLVKLTRGGWNETAVRKVLKIFAFGGHATDLQIQTWADMYASDAIVEMLNFDEHNLELSPLAIGETYTDSATLFDEDGIGTLEGWANFISDDASNLPIPTGSSRSNLGLDGGNFDDGYNRMITVRGLNPFRQRIGFWETNYHLATNLDASVSRRQMARYYDEIMEAHQAGLPYHEVMGVAAKSAAAAMQYGHRNNRWNFSTGECDCNDDFAREIHQLYYGIFGEGDPNHEDVTIPETAKMLTDMPVPYISGFGYDLAVDFQTNDHFPGAVMIFDQNQYAPITGVDAEEKIDNLMPVSIQHPESLQNLPIMIISVLADDNLSESRKDQLRAAWAAMLAEPAPDNTFLNFIQTYAISGLFHGPAQLKYFTSHERALYMANKNNLENIEAYFGGARHNGSPELGKSVGGLIADDFAGEFFRPLHNVFGGQTSVEASDSAIAFEGNYNRQTDREDLMREAVQCLSCDIGDTDTSWEKSWPDVLPQRADGNYYVSDVAEWLWNHAVGNMDNYTELERAHLYSLLGAAHIDEGGGSSGSNFGDDAFDFNLVMCVIKGYQVDEAATDAPIIDILTGSTWDDYCRESDDGGSYLQYELDALNAEYTGVQILNDPEMQSILTDLGNQTMPFNATTGHADTGYTPGATKRKHARERVNNALGFIFSTPFVFAEGQ